MKNRGRVGKKNQVSSRRIAGHSIPGSRGNGCKTGLSQARTSYLIAAGMVEESLYVRQPKSSRPNRYQLAELHAKCVLQECPTCGATIKPAWIYRDNSREWTCQHMCPTDGCPNMHGFRKSGTLKNRLKLIAKLVDRDGDACWYCSVTIPFAAYTLDHYIPKSRGGTRDLSNLRLACATCNNRKGSMHPDDFALERMAGFYG
jgi:5-methylcytosine-specific restriction endonuclease McrA